MGIFWETDFGDYNRHRKKETVDLGPMGPNHPGWRYAKREIEDLLHQAGRVYDQSTIEGIAQDQSLWRELSREAAENMIEQSQQMKFDAMANILREVKKDTTNKGLLKNLFGGETEVRE